MIGQNMHGFDMNKRTKKQRVLSPLGLLTYNPDTQSRGGTIDLIGENGLIISLHYQT